MGARAGAHPWDGFLSFKMHYSTVFKHQLVTGRPLLGEILYPPLAGARRHQRALLLIAMSNSLLLITNSYLKTAFEVSSAKRLMLCTDLPPYIRVSETIRYPGQTLPTNPQDAYVSTYLQLTINITRTRETDATCKLGLN